MTHQTHTPITRGAEEYGHIELVSHTINMRLTGSTTRGNDPSDAPLEVAVADVANRLFGKSVTKS